MFINILNSDELLFARNYVENAVLTTVQTEFGMSVHFLMFNALEICTKLLDFLFDVPRSLLVAPSNFHELPLRVLTELEGEHYSTPSSRNCFQSSVSDVAFCFLAIRSSHDFFGVNSKSL